MMNRKELLRAIDLHAEWRKRFVKEVSSGRDGEVPSGVAQDDACGFGSWLHSLPPDDRASQHWKTVHALHEKFHGDAARVAALALEGRLSKATAAISPGGAFAAGSAELTAAMMAWLSDNP